MFTGIVEEIGIIENLNKYTNGLQATIKAHKVLEGVQLGDSIAVNGVCVTVTSFTTSSFTVDIMQETVDKTIWQYAQALDKVHLERALTLNKPLGGHIVTGHINGIGKIINVAEAPLHTVATIEPPPALLRYIVDQGSIAINGVSLTVINTTESSFSISLIPHTIAETTILSSKLVNLEVDIIAKYLEKLLSPQNHTKQEQTLSIENLHEAGYF